MDTFRDKDMSQFCELTSLASEKTHTFAIEDSEFDIEMKLQIAWNASLGVKHDFAAYKNLPHYKIDCNMDGVTVFKYALNKAKSFQYFVAFIQ